MRFLKLFEAIIPVDRPAELSFYFEEEFGDLADNFELSHAHESKDGLTHQIGATFTYKGTRNVHVYTSRSADASTGHPYKSISVTIYEGTHQLGTNAFSGENGVGYDPQCMDYIDVWKFVRSTLDRGDRDKDYVRPGTPVAPQTKEPVTA